MKENGRKGDILLYNLKVKLNNNNNNNNKNNKK